jgi:hypothetical protein
MLNVTIDKDNLVAVLEPEGALSETDFQSVAREVDPLIEKYDHLAGIIIHTKSFPGWESFAALISHMRFVKNHHRKIARVALVTDSLIGNFAEIIGSHFIKAEIHVFPYPKFEQAKAWVTGNA